MALEIISRWTRTSGSHPRRMGNRAAIGGAVCRAARHWRGLETLEPRTLLTAAVVDHHIFYKGSTAFDITSDDAAIATDKTALLPGQTATFANYTSYTRGINGIMIDLSSLAGTLSASDFTFKIGGNSPGNTDPQSWTAAPAPIAVVTRAGAGPGGSARVEITWADNVIQNEWLQVTLKGGSGSTSGLPADDIFYFGNAIGETGNDPSNAKVDVVDELSARAGQTSNASVTNPYDFNRDGVVDGNDLTIARSNVTWFMNGLQNISAPSTALQQYAWVLNNIEYTPYAGAMKGAQATLDTKIGNDWDTDSLLASMLNQNGIATRYVSAQVETPIATAMSWLGVTDPNAAVSVLSSAKLNPVSVTNSGGTIVSVRFDHTWLEASLPVNGSQQWVDLDPSWKFRDFQTGMNLLPAVPFNEADYLSIVRTQLPYQYYQDKASQYLATNAPGVSLADAAHDGPIHQQAITSLPTSLPFTVVGTTTVNTTIPQTMTHRVQLTLSQGSTVLWSYLLVVPNVCEDRITVDYGAGNIPELLLNGTVVASGPAIASGSAVHLKFEHYDSRATASTFTVGYDRTEGQVLAVGLDAGQMSNAMVDALQKTVTAANIAALEGQPYSVDDQIGGLAALALARYFHNTEVAKDAVDSLTGAIEVHYDVGSGIATANPQVTQYPTLQNTGVPTGLVVDIANFRHLALPIDNNHANDAARDKLIGDDSSDEESAVWECLVNSSSMSTIKSLQLATVNNIPIVTVTSSNQATTLPLLNLPAGAISNIVNYVSQGATVTVPEQITPLNNWTGVGYFVNASTFQAYIIFGGIATGAESSQDMASLEASWVPMQGGYATGTPGAGDPISVNTNQTDAGDPIDVANGNVTLSQNDFSIPNLGVPLSFTRNYNSQNAANVGMGAGWSFSYSDHLMFGAGQVTWEDSQGHYYSFVQTGSAYIVPNLLHGTFTASGGGYQWRDKTGLTYSFNSSGWLTSIIDRNGNGVVVAHNALGQLTTVSDAVTPSRQLTFSYGGGFLTNASDFTGRTWSYNYDNSEVDRVTAPGDASTPVAVTFFSYYSDPVLGGLLHMVTAPDKGVVTFAYYADRRGFSVTDATGVTTTLSYNQYRNETNFNDGRGNVTGYFYDSLGENTSIVNPDQSAEKFVWSNALRTSQTDAMGQTATAVYDALGNATQIVDLNGVATNYTFDPLFSNVTSLTQSGGRITQFGYDIHGNLTSIIDPMGDQTKMTYDSRGDLLTRIQPKGVLTPAAGDYTTTYSHNNAGQILTLATDLPSLESFTYNTRGDLLSQTDADNHTTSYSYDLHDRPLTITDALNCVTSLRYNAVGNLISSTDALGRTTAYTYDLRSLLLSTTNADGTVSTCAYDADENLISSTDELGHSTLYTYDARNRVTDITRPDGSVAATLYDGDSRVVRTIDANGNATAYTYDRDGRLLTSTDALNDTTTRTYDSVGNLLTLTDPNGNKTTYVYDLDNRRTQTKDALTKVTTFTYDANSNLVTLTDPMNRTTTYGYDVLNRQTTSTDLLADTTTTAYDAVGNVLSVTDPLGHATQFTYDVLNRKLTSLDASSKLTTLTYDSVGNLLTLTDPDNNKTSYTYDSRNRLSTQTDQLGNVKSYVYDAKGNEVSLTDADGRVTRFTYDACDRATNEVWYNASGQTTDTISTTYSPMGQVLTVGDTNSTMTYTYDAAERVASTRMSGLGAAALPQTTTYNDTFGPGSLQVGNSYYKFYPVTVKAGDTLTITMSSNAFTPYLFVYPPSGAMLQNGGVQGGTPATITVTAAMAGTWQIEATTYPGLTGAYSLTVTTQTPGAQDVVLNYGHDSAGNVISITDSLGGSQTSTYDPLNRESSIQQTGTNVASTRADFTYNNAGQANTVKLYSDLAGTQNVATSVYGYDAVGRLNSLVQTHGNATINSYSWAYDVASRITQQTSVDGTSTFNYDNTDQLTVATQSFQPNEVYSYDANGNRTNTGDSTGADNRLTSDGTYNYQYDNEGNRVSRTKIATDEVTTYQWDNRNRLTRVTTSTSTGTVESDTLYTYDALNRRIAKSVDADGSGPGTPVAEHYAFDGLNMLFTLDGNGAISHRFLNGPGVNRTLADQNATGTILWYLTDGLGTVRDIVNNSGVVQNHISYDSFGNITAQTNASVGTRFGYTGQQYDAETGMWYMHARYYDPKVGVFISSDPMEFGAGDMNTYRYVMNRVTCYVDAVGLCGNAFSFYQPSPLPASLYEDFAATSQQDNEQQVQRSLDLTPDQQAALNAFNFKSVDTALSNSTLIATFAGGYEAQTKWFGANVSPIASLGVVVQDYYNIGNSSNSEVRLAAENKTLHDAAEYAVGLTTGLLFEGNQRAAVLVQQAESYVIEHPQDVQRAINQVAQNSMWPTAIAMLPLLLFAL